jgi:cell division protein ZapE
MSLVDRYKTAMQRPDMAHDAAQQTAIAKLAALTETLIDDERSQFSSLLKKFTSLADKRNRPVRGIYLWGGVGRGKTWLMNLFYEEVQVQRKLRIHFHHFMLIIHGKLGEITRRNDKNRKNPLQQIAKELADKYSLLCIDEFIVTNITDAMILSELLHRLFNYRVCLVATSNRVPDDLYLNGLQRERFLPAIDLIKYHTEVFHLDGGIDHRTSLLEQADIYYCPASDNIDQAILQRVQELAITPVKKAQILSILKRDIQTVYCSEELAWFEFAIICNEPRAAQDYIELARQYNTIIITNIPVLDEYSDDRARRFIYLIDELYDRNVKIICSAAAEPGDLYQGSMLKFAFQRTCSRLIEMRSHQYLTKAHKPF